MLFQPFCPFDNHIFISFDMYVCDMIFISSLFLSRVVAVPELYEACDRYGISNRVSRFVIPFAASLKGDGSAVYVTTAVVFIAQLSGVSINAGSAAIIMQVCFYCFLFKLRVHKLLIRLYFL